MPTAITIPKATITMESADIVAWRKQAGDAVRKDEILFEMETDKVVVEVPAPVSGTLLRIERERGTAKLEEPVAWIGELGESIVDAPLPVPAPTGRSAAADGPSPATNGNPASPAARRRARELGIAIESVSGSGPGGRVTEQDVENAKNRP